MTNIFAATLAYHGMVTTQFHESFLAMQMECMRQKRGLGRLCTNSTFPSASRNMGAGIVIAESQFTHLLTIDADMGWKPDLLSRFLKMNKDIVAAMYPRRVLTEKAEFIGVPIPEEPEIDGFKKGYLCGCGFTLIKRETLLRMAAAYPERQHKDSGLSVPVWDLFPSGFAPDTKTVITDDIGFSRLARKAGFDIWLDLTSHLSHTGPTTFDWGTWKDNYAGLDKPETAA
jgi:hypothetical protein